MKLDPSVVRSLLQGRDIRNWSYACRQLRAWEDVEGKRFTSDGTKLWGNQRAWAIMMVLDPTGDSLKRDWNRGRLWWQHDPG